MDVLGLIVVHSTMTNISRTLHDLFVHIHTYYQKTLCGAPAHHSAEQPYRPLGGAVRRGAVALAGICRGVWRLASRSPEAPGGW